jgi:uncharacterized Zn finger protein
MSTYQCYEFQAIDRPLTEEEQQAAEAEARRIRDLEALAKRETKAWAKVEALIEKMQGRAYDEAVQLLFQLRDLADYRGQEAAFQEHLKKIYEQYNRRPALLGRLRKARLDPDRRGTT